MGKSPLKVLHIITRFDKGGSAENTFLTAAHLDRERFHVVLVAGFTGEALNHEAHQPDPHAGESLDPVRLPSAGLQIKPVRTNRAPSRPHMDGQCSDSENIAVKENMASLRKGGVRLIACPPLVREPRPIADVTAFFSLCGIIRGEQPDIVHTHTSKAGILGRWAAWCCRVPVIVHTPHGHVFQGYFGPVKTQLFILFERWTAMITDTLVMLTPQEMKEHLAFGIAPPEKFAVIHSGVDLNRFNPGEFSQGAQQKHFQILENRIVIGAVGRLTAIKGQDVLLRAFAELAVTRDDMYLVLLGEGEMRGEFEKTARHLGVFEMVRFLGWRPDVAAVMASFDIFCLPSLNEGMGKVVVEAMAMGLPVVASDVGGVKDLVHDGENGLLVPPGDPHALAGALAALCRDPQRRRLMGAAGRKSAPAYGIPAMISKIETLYQSLTAAAFFQEDHFPGGGHSR